MRWSDAVGQGDWIGPRLDDFYEGLITSTVPRGFPAYLRLLHPVEVMNDAQPRRGPVRWAEVAAWSGVKLTPQTPFHAIATPAREPDGPAPWSTDQRPDEGTVSEPDASALLEVLAAHTPPGMPCWFAVWDGWGWDNTLRFTIVAAPGAPVTEPYTLPDIVPPEVRAGPRIRLPGRDYLLFTGEIDDALALVEEKGQTPNLRWPQDRSWCVATEIDNDITYIGGGSDLIAALHAAVHLETQPAHEGERARSAPAR